MNMFFSRWPSLLLTVALLVIVGICLKRIDFLLIDEVKAVISIAFGFATSCLLLSLIWILHRKPVHATWPAVAQFAAVETPNMHPRASIISESDAAAPTSADGSGRRTTADILAQQDQPPDYENALINSKPISWIGVAVVNRTEDQKIRAELEQHSSSVNGKRHSTGSRKISAQQQQQPTENMTQLALSIVRGFTSEPPNNAVGQEMSIGDGARSCRDDATRSSQADRKPSYCQLDVGQLLAANQGSPPKYCEITMPSLMADEGLANDVLSNQSNEPRGGTRPDS